MPVPGLGGVGAWLRGRGGLRPWRCFLDCVRVIGRVSPFRTVCLEETVAAMLALAMTGRRAGWCHGIAADPIRLHAWLALNGHLGGEPTFTVGFTPLTCLSEPDQGRAGKGATP